ncbi:hypothetical protein [Rossellomorea vietnamensis]|uniref:hypothetical protein n=1 Tax=Rossellomorea vietnamensis TaxID=218284 RepID=UPI003D296D24
MLLGIAGSFLVPKKGDYVGESTVYTGSISLQILSDPGTVVDLYGKNLDKDIDAYVSGRNFIKIKLYGDDEAKVKKNLKDITSNLEEALVGDYDERIKYTQGVLDATTSELEKLKESKQKYQDRLDINNTQLTIEDTEFYSELLLHTETEIASAISKIERMERDIEFFEEPNVTNMGVVKTDRNTMKFAIAGLLLGIFLTIVFLILWKYIIDARRALKHD